MLKSAYEGINMQEARRGVQEELGVKSGSYRAREPAAKALLLPARLPHAPCLDATPGRVCAKAGEGEPAWCFPEPQRK